MSLHNRKFCQSCDGIKTTSKTVNYFYAQNLVGHTLKCKQQKSSVLTQILFKTLWALVCVYSVSAQTYNQPPMQGQYFAPAPSNSNYMKNSQAFRQEVMRLEINVVRGAQSLPITQVPRVQKDDLIKMKLSSDAVAGIKPDQSLYDWTFLIAFVNPNRRTTGEKTSQKKNTDSSADESVTEEINFRKTGWYKEYSFTVPYDSQPVFFLYPKPKYRAKILKLISQNYDEVRKLGEKTIELAGAYSQINSFLNELQFVLWQTQNSRYGTNIGYFNSSSGNAGTGYSYNSYYSGYGNYPSNGFNYNSLAEQTIERLARSFNIELPQCWGNSTGGYGSYSGYNSYGSGYGNYGTYGNYGSSYGSYGGYGASYGYGNQNNFGHAISQDLISRAQCLARNIRLEDFDFSVANLLKQGGILAATQLRDRYPQLAYWISVAAVAIDFIVKVFQKTPLKIVPTIIQSTDGTIYGNVNPQSNSLNNQNNSFNSYSTQTQSSYHSSASGQNAANNQKPAVKLSVYAESQPDSQGFVTAYPIVAHKWQAEPDPEVISLYPPVLTEPCLHVGVNLLKSAELTSLPEEDVYSRNFRLQISSVNGFKKDFPLKKNIGLGGWELNLTPEELYQIPKTGMTLESELIGERGFNEIRSPKFDLPLPLGTTYEITPETKNAFSIGGRRTVSLKNTVGSARCLQSITYKPSSGGQFVFETGSKGGNKISFSPDGREVFFDIDTTGLQPGAGILEIKSYGGEIQSSSNQSPSQSSNNLPIKLFAAPPQIKQVRIARGDKFAVITGERLEQIQSVKINGKPASILGKQIGANQPLAGGQQLSTNGLVRGTAAPTFLSLPTTATNEKIAVFDHQNDFQADSEVTIELVLEENRTLKIEQPFDALPARPSVVASTYNEVIGVAQSSDKTPTRNDSNSFGKQDKAGSAATQPGLQSKIFTARYKSIDSLPNDLTSSSQMLPAGNSQSLQNKFFFTDTRTIVLNVQTNRTDYDFKAENISLETRIENAAGQPGLYGAYAGAPEIPSASFEVLDWKNLKILLRLPESAARLIGGRRIQFRIRDKDRGDSDWYTLLQPFVRIPEIASVFCKPEMNNFCELKGAGVDYISQVSVDGGSSWYPQTGSLQTQPTADGQQSAFIPFYGDKKNLVVKFRDLALGRGFVPIDYQFVNTVKEIPKTKLKTEQKAEEKSENRQGENTPLMSAPKSQTRKRTKNNGTDNLKPKF